MRMVEMSGIEIATQSFGSADNPAIVLIMGATASMLGWPEDLCKILAKHGFYVIRFDHRDTGRSTTRAPGKPSYTAEDMAEDVVGVMDAYGLQEASLMGMSLGGLLAQMIALIHPDRVRSLALLSAEPLGWDGEQLPYITPTLLEHFAGLPALDWQDHEAVVAFLLKIDKISAGPGYPLDEAGLTLRIEEVLARTERPASMFNHASVSTTEDWTGRFREISVPTLVIHGENDPVLPVENGQAIAEGIEGAQLFIMSGVGHELPAAILPEIADHVTDHARRHL